MNPGRSAAGAVVLAGGRSSRMGRDKAWLRYRGQALLCHVLDVTAEVVDVRVIVARKGQRLPCWPEGVGRIDDPPDREGEGPLAAAVAGLRRLADQGVERAVLTSCDAAALRGRDVELLLGRLGGSVHAAVPRDPEGRWQPLLAGYAPGPVAERGERLLAQGRRSLRALVAALPPEALVEVSPEELSSPSVLWPCNTPDQFARLERLT